MRKSIVLCLIALISVIPVFAENTGTIGSSTPTDSIKVSLDLGAVNSATVGFSSSEVTNFASSTALTEGADKLQPSSADGKAKLANDIYAYAKIQYPGTCYVTIKADDAMIGYKNSNKDELDNIFDTYYKGTIKRPIGLKASLNLLKTYITDFRGDIWVYSKENFGTMITFVLPLR